MNNAQYLVSFNVFYRQNCFFHWRDNHENYPQIDFTLLSAESTGLRSILQMLWLLKNMNTWVTTICIELIRIDVPLIIALTLFPIHPCAHCFVQSLIPLCCFFEVINLVTCELCSYSDNKVGERGSLSPTATAAMQLQELLIRCSIMSLVGWRLICGRMPTFYSISNVPFFCCSFFCFVFYLVKQQGQCRCLLM